ncbi:Nuclease HARBI1 [Phytophthora megakarya]|uniref:Nuclease HARBI1 n=1 Tax=Phytophthora megakarya TaxID=4795 RepID=A0A225VA92_9STRA|nr:Nuclease HARBI1 [Phytophthora megakarya]
MIRNVIERVIELLKRRFRVLRTTTEFELINVKVVIVACGNVHIVFRDFDSSDLGDEFEMEEEDTDDDGVGDGDIACDFHKGTSWRTWMASALWREYKEF